MSASRYSLKLSPVNVTLDVTQNVRLYDALSTQGVEFPCGGLGRCKGCRVKILQGSLPVCEEEEQLLGALALSQGWRMACRHSINGDLELELAQWEMPILSDESSFAFIPREGLGVAIDLGTTTIAAQILDLRSGSVLGVRTALNAQARHGADVMSRIDHALRAGPSELRKLVREQLGTIVSELLHEAAKLSSHQPLSRVVIVGNTAMHHLFCGIDIAPLSTHPFEPKHSGRFQFSPSDLGWSFTSEMQVEFLPCIGGFVGSDILAGVVATGMHESSELQALMDLGTNGEVVVGNRERLFCTSTAAGPAFEGARISMGMRAATGAISAVKIENGKLACRVIGEGMARGLCGSGLVDAVAAGLELKTILPGGRVAGNLPISLSDNVALFPADVRELQLAKGAIAAGLRMLTARFGASLKEIRQLHLAGAFGNYINRSSAQRIGLLRLPLDGVVPAGNTALLGAKRALFEDADAWDGLARRIEFVALHEDPEFQDIYAEEMRFPG